MSKHDDARWFRRQVLKRLGYIGDAFESRHGETLALIRLDGLLDLVDEASKKVDDRTDVEFWGDIARQVFEHYEVEGP